MAAMTKTLLEIVQNILSSMDSEDVNSISDSVEAEQIAQVVEDTFYNIIATRSIPEHESLMKLTALSDVNFPTHFSYPANVKVVKKLWYDVSDNDTFEYREIRWCEPEDFLDMVDTRALGATVTNVVDKSGGTNLRIFNDRHPTVYTSFDDDYIVLDAHKASVDTTLQESKIRGFGTTYPIFSLTDSHVPDLDATMFPYLINESKSVCFSIFKGGADPKIEQATKRQKNYVQNDMHKQIKASKRNRYGRR
mgnify:FL=1